MEYGFGGILEGFISMSLVLGVCVIMSLLKPIECGESSSFKLNS